MKQALEPIGHSIQLSAAVVASPTGLTWTRDPTADELDADDYFVQRCDGSVGWWMGDVICKRIDLDLRARAEKAQAHGEPVFLTAEDRHGHLRAFAREYAATRNLSESSVILRTHVSSFFPLHSRLCSLTWTHHAEVYGAVSGQSLAVAEMWLSRAHANGWSVADLRRELRTANATPNATPNAGLAGLPVEVVEVERWAAHEWPQIKRADPQRATWLLSQMTMTVRTVDHLRSVARMGENPQPDARPAKSA